MPPRRRSSASTHNVTRMTSCFEHPAKRFFKRSTLKGSDQLIEQRRVPPKLSHFIFTDQCRVDLNAEAAPADVADDLQDLIQTICATRTHIDRSADRLGAL